MRAYEPFSTDILRDVRDLENTWKDITLIARTYSYELDQRYQVRVLRKGHEFDVCSRLLIRKLVK